LIRRGRYERVLQLTDLIVAAAPSARRRELLRWRDLVAATFIAPSPGNGAHRRAFLALLLITPELAKQVPLLLQPRRSLPLMMRRDGARGLQPA